MGNAVVKLYLLIDAKFIQLIFYIPNCINYMKFICTLILLMLILLMLSFNPDFAVENLLRLLPKAFGKNLSTVSTTKSWF